MINEKDYTIEEVLDALHAMSHEYNKPELYVLMHGVPQLVKRLEEAENRVIVVTAEDPASVSIEVKSLSEYGGCID